MENGRPKVHRFQEGVEYTIDDKHGVCNMEVLGDPGTELQLIQS